MHTRGPWQAELPGRDDAHMCRITTAWLDGNCYLQLGETWNPHHGVSYVGLSRQECMDNARLMAAAPSLQDALERIKAITKQVPASTWTPEFREIANIAHSTLREYCFVETARGREEMQRFPKPHEAGSNPVGPILRESDVMRDDE